MLNVTVTCQCNTDRKVSVVPIRPNPSKAEVTIRRRHVTDGRTRYRPPAQEETLVARFSYQQHRDRTSDVMSPLKATETISGESNIIFPFRYIHDMLRTLLPNVRNALTNNIVRSPTLASFKRDFSKYLSDM